jgi:hypothetical protein
MRSREIGASQRGQVPLNPVAYETFCTERLQVNYPLQFSVFWPSRGMYIHAWLHRSALTLAKVYRAYVLCCRVDTFGCNAAMYVPVHDLYDSIMHRCMKHTT